MLGLVWSAARKDLRRLARDPVSLLLWASIPLVVGALILLAVGGQSGPQPQAEVVVADEDGSLISTLLVNAMSSAPDGLIQTTSMARAEGRAKVDAGEVTAQLIIPAGFGQAVFEEQPTALVLVTNPAQTILPSIVEQYLSVLVDAGFYLHRVLGTELQQLNEMVGASSDPGSEQVAAISVAINEALSGIGSHLFPPVLELEEEVADTGEGGERPPIAWYFLPGLVVMGLVFTAQGLADDAWQERTQGTLRRAAVAPAGIPALIFGKALAGGAILLAVAAIVFVAGGLYLSIPLARLPGAIAWGALSGLSFMAFFLVLQSLASSQRAATVLSSAVVFPLLMVGGSFFPAEAMPDWLAGIGSYTPNGWAVRRMTDLVLARASAPQMAIGAVAFVVATLVLLGLATRRLSASTEG